MPHPGDKTKGVFSLKTQKSQIHAVHKQSFKTSLVKLKNSNKASAVHVIWQLSRFFGPREILPYEETYFFAETSVNFFAKHLGYSCSPAIYIAYFDLRQHCESRPVRDIRLCDDTDESADNPGIRHFPSAHLPGQNYWKRLFRPFVFLGEYSVLYILCCLHRWSVSL